MSTYQTITCFVILPLLNMIMKAVNGIQFCEKLKLHTYKQIADENNDKIMTNCDHVYECSFLLQLMSPVVKLALYYSNLKSALTYCTPGRLNYKFCSFLFII